MSSILLLDIESFRTLLLNSGSDLILKFLIYKKISLLPLSEEKSIINLPTKSIKE
jgi:hypothetical protein